ncbi:ImmA/IrrE family metallo-endopeptidase [Nonlabens mediterrranea]|uniref:ImmA/IrrE family metallo-endopeptidase n=1 Tax=Nonlabens mediterrranea TaxID=1419947 RepID=A0ABS0A0B5_9FLAO|nr:ImmA/IrrE family metallo-endopeptidase [Nonlabens mediterrranea]
MNKIESTAVNLLKKHDLFDYPVDLPKLVQSLDIKMIPHEFDDDVSGMLIIDDNQVTLGYNVRDGKERKRFTIAHELGHYVLHGNKNKLFLDKKSVYFRNNINSANKKQEIEANRFAAAILMPTELLVKHIEQKIDFYDSLEEEEAIEKIAFEFKVSKISMTYRLVNLGMIEKNF